jgi:DnaJ-class molecular chaperone
MCEGRGTFTLIRSGIEADTRRYTETYTCSDCSGRGYTVEENWCSLCARTGQVSAEPGWVTCPTCNGFRQVQTQEHYRSGMAKVAVCPMCAGRGSVWGTVYRPDFR